MTLKLGLPSKGRLMDNAFAWFGARGLTIESAGAGREYVATAELDGLEPVLLSAGEIPRELARGTIQLGVTGVDMVRERLGDWQNRLREVARLGFGHADLVIAVPDFWADVTTLHDLDAVAAAFRGGHGHRLRIATKYHRLVRNYLREHGVADYRLVDSQGATEGTVRNGAAEAIADITTSGETLAANHLRPLSDGPILKSEAALFRTRRSGWSDAQREAYDRLTARLGLG